MCYFSTKLKMWHGLFLFIKSVRYTPYLYNKVCVTVVICDSGDGGYTEGCLFFGGVSLSKTFQKHCSIVLGSRVLCL